MIHKAVLVRELIENLNLKPGMTVVDGTLGAGGHASEILKKILPGGKLIAIDWDKKAIENIAAKKEFQEHIKKRKLILIEDNYSNLENILRGLGLKTVDAVFADLGFSSDQIENAKRGFSFLKDGPLDMRYSPKNQELTASEIVNNFSEREIENILRENGEERYAKRIASRIVTKRKTEKIERTGQLVGAISEAVPETYKKKRIHFATKVFQALRIAVNDEFANLKKLLKAAIDNLAGEGRLGIVSFHSLEDRIVKNFFREGARDCVCPPNFPKCVCDQRKTLKIITKKPITASEKEIQENPRARSAKLRAAERI